MIRVGGAVVIALVLSGCHGGSSRSAGVTDAPPADSPTEAVTLAPSLACLRQHPFIVEFDTLIDTQSQYSYNTFDGDEAPLPPNLYRDAPSANGLPKPQATAPIVCGTNRQYRTGVARVDITGPWAGRSRAGMEAPIDLLSGLNQRVFARAFVIGEDCTGSSVVLVNADLGFMHRSVRDAVIQRLADNPATSEIDPNSLLLAATHTHNFSGGYSHDLMFSALHGGHKPDVLGEIVEGISEAITEAWLQSRQAQPGDLSLAMNELLHTNANRHASGYRQNTQAERSRYRDVNGNDQLTNILATQLNLYDAGGQLRGLLNWYAVHPTAGMMGTLAHGDSKGYAAITLERAFNRSERKTPFVAGFLQSDEGDVVPIRYVDNEQPGQPRLPPLLTSVLGEDVTDDLANVAVSGTRQASNALELAVQPQQYVIHGSIDYRMRYIDFSDQTVTDPVILASLQHPPELDSPVKRTCDPVYGMSSVGKEAFGKYQTCESAATVPADEFFNDLSSGDLQRSSGDIAKTGMCVMGHVDLSAASGPDYSCQAEKAYLFGTGDQGPAYTQVDLPFQILRIGNFAIVSLPWEITTMAGRRIRETVLNELRMIGVDFIVIAGLANEYAQYITTREEYARQGYEAASNHFGPWSLAAARQALRAMSLAMVNGQPRSPARVGTTEPHLPNVLATDPLIADVPARGPFTAPIVDVESQYAIGERLIFSYQAGYPNNNSYRKSHYFEIERQMAGGTWVPWLTDTDPGTILHWKGNPPGPMLGSPESILEIDWYISRDTPPGRYRIIYRTTTREVPGSNTFTEYEATTEAFEIVGAASDCVSG